MSIKSMRLLFCAALCALFGCREVQYYGFKHVDVALSPGKLGINVIGNYSENYEVDGKKLAAWRFPYNLQFTYAVVQEAPLVKLEVASIELVGIEDGITRRLEGISGDRVRLVDGNKLIRISAGPLTSDEYIFQNYLLKASLRIYASDVEYVDEQVSVLLETEYREEMRSDWLDENTSA